MITDKLTELSGIIKDIKEIYRLLNKNVNVLITARERLVGKTFVFKGVYHAFANAPLNKTKIIYLKANGAKIDLEEIIFLMSEKKYNDLYDPDLKEQSFNEFRKGNQQQLERRILTSLKSASNNYLIFIEERKKLTESIRLFLSELMKTGKVTIAAESNSLSDAKIREFYQGFDKYEIKKLDDRKMGLLFDYFVKEDVLKIKDEDYGEIKEKLLIQCAGNIGKLKEKLERGNKEKNIKKEDILEKFPSSFKKEIGIGGSLIILLIAGMAYRYFLRGLGSVTDKVAGGIIFAISLCIYRILTFFK